MATFDFGTNDNTTVKLWSGKIVRDVYKMSMFSDLLHSPRNPRAIRDRDGKMVKRAQGLIRVHTDLQERRGDRVRITNIARVTGRGIHGDEIAVGQGANLTPYTMDLSIENVIQPVRSSGELAEQMSDLEFREESHEALGPWATVKDDEGFIITLFGLTSWNNSPYDNWSNNGETEVFNNTIQAFDSDHLIYAGTTATSNATLGAGDKMCYELLIKAETTAFSDLSIPIDPFMIDGQPSLILFCNDRAKEQLLMDDDFKSAVENGDQRGKDNPAISGNIGKISRTWVVPIPKAPNPAANVGQAVLCGRDCLQYVPVRQWKWWEGYEDIAERRKVIAIKAMKGMAPTFFNSTRRNAIALRHYQRS